MTRPDVEVMRAMEGMFWLELREPRRLPDRKGPWPKTMLAKVLRKFMAARPEAYITVVTVSEAGPRFEDGPEALEMTDVRSRATAARHRRTSHEARTALRTSGTGRSEAEAMRQAVLAVVRKAYLLLDDTEDDGLDEMRIDRRSWDELSAAMDALEAADPTGENNYVSAVEAALGPAISKTDIPS